MIYALVDQETLQKRGVLLQDLLIRINLLPVPLLQYRNKFGSLLEKQRALKEIRRHYTGKLIINDTIELIAYADGLHLGQEDIVGYSQDKNEAIMMIRQKIGDKILGLSTHNRAEIEEANQLDIDYIGLGAYRSTGTKRDAVVMGTSLLRIAKLSKHPVAIIGGVRLEDEFEPPIEYKVIGSGLYEYLQCH
jgi:thiamine-phosphate pyrophosphorylase